MGGMHSGHFQETVRKNQDWISEMNRLKMERWVQMHSMIRERELATQIARSRELFFWIGTFYLVSAGGLISRFKRLRKPGVLAPLIPGTFVLAYFADAAYGTKIHRIRSEAEMIMQHEDDLLKWPCGVPTVSEIDQARMETEMDSFLHPATP